MVSVFMNEYLILGTSYSGFEFWKIFQRTIGFDLVPSTCFMNNSIAGSFG